MDELFEQFADDYLDMLDNPEGNRNNRSSIDDHPELWSRPMFPTMSFFGSGVNVLPAPPPPYFLEGHHNAQPAVNHVQHHSASRPADCQGSGSVSTNPSSTPSTCSFGTSPNILASQPTIFNTLQGHHYNVSGLVGGSVLQYPRPIDLNLTCGRTEDQGRRRPRLINGSGYKRKNYSTPWQQMSARPAVVVGDPSINEEKSDSDSSSDDGQLVIDDDALLTLSVKELNKLLSRIPGEQREMLKRRRRTLKNRGYARSCRNKKFFQMQQLEATINNLRQKVHHLQVQINAVSSERDMYKQRYKELLDECSSGTTSHSFVYTSSLPPKRI